MERIRTEDGEAGPLALALELDWHRLAKAWAADKIVRRRIRLGLETACVVLVGLAATNDTVTDWLACLLGLGC